MLFEKFESFVGVNFFTLIFAWANLLVLYFVLRKILSPSDMELLNDALHCFANHPDWWGCDEEFDEACDGNCESCGFGCDSDDEAVEETVEETSEEPAEEVAEDTKAE